MKTFYVTTPIYYANNSPHLGTLYTTIVADAITRFKRQRGFETYFLTGTDEHGINIQRLAQAKGITPKEYTDEIVAQFKDMFSQFGLDSAHNGFDIFMRTTELFHCEGVSSFWRRVAQSKTPKGREAIYKGYYEGWFCPSCAAYKTEDEYEKSEVEGEPPRCLVHLRPLDRVSEDGYFFRLSDFDEALLARYEADPQFIQPEARRNEVISFVRGGLQDLSISRQKSSVGWAIPVPDDPSQSIYVWFDALTNYITAIGYGNEERERAVGFKKFWPALHLVGKDILRFHAVYWPAFLIAAGLDLPRTVFAHGMLLDASSRKMSKTLGNTIDLEILKRYFPNDAIRYFCLREVVFGQDGKVSYEAIIDRTNSDLASGLGNLSSRTLTMVKRYCEGRIPSQEITDDSYLFAKRASVDADPSALASTLEHARDEFLLLFDSYSFNRALEVAWAIIARTDKMLSDAKPWELAKNASQRQVLSAVLYRAAETLRWLCVLLYPVLPETAEMILTQMGISASVAASDPSKLKWGGLPAGIQIGEVKALFPRVDKARTMDEIEHEQSRTGTGAVGKASGVPPPPVTETNTAASVRSEEGLVIASTSDSTGSERAVIEIGDFAKVDLRVGEVLTAERVPKSDKLLRFTIDLGEGHPRQILAGIAEHYEPEKMIGRKVIVVANLKPRKLRGHESQGMILAASAGNQGRPVIATFIEDVPNGAQLK